MSKCPKCDGKKYLIFTSLSTQIVKCHVCGGTGTVPFIGADPEIKAKRRLEDDAILASQKSLW